MKLLMAGINYNNTCISKREKLSFTPEQIGNICKNICRIEDIYGCIILSTCNRTEIYISCSPYGHYNADDLLLKYAGITDFDGVFEKIEDTDVVYYIMELACGLKSQIVGESQIVTQINSALEISMENNCTDSVLDTLFRIAVSAGKYTLTNARITNIPLSCAYGAMDMLLKKYSNLKEKKCVIIGNGKMSKILQQLLISKECHVWVTLRSYKHGNNETVIGCSGISYNERYEYIKDCNFVVSATRSPHYTLTYDKFSLLKKMPEIAIDLAMPRDIDPEIKKLCNCFNIDDLGYETKIDENSLQKVYDIIDKFAADFIQWYNYKLSLPTISIIKHIITKRIIKSSEITKEVLNNTEGSVAMIVEKTVDMLLGGMKNNVLPDTMEACRKKIEERARF
ncbi:MAG: hypothetical protein Q4D26_07365 [Clostridia bacterium]|nr:hypothetical protein [Clostridia bacterium]